MNICVIGAGTYGCYLAHLLAEQHPHSKVTMLDVGDAETRNEQGIGFVSRAVGAPYHALSEGRFFGLGGSSARWGGQILTFTENDFRSPTGFLADIVRLNVKHRGRVMRRLGLPDLGEERRLSDGLFVKPGVWLSYGRRNLYRALKLRNLPNIAVRTHCRATRLTHEGGVITAVHVSCDGEDQALVFDHYFLATGAFEGNRLLAVSGLGGETFSFSDHLSQKAFRVRGGTVLGEDDFRFKFRGLSLVTKRFVGEVDGVSFFAHPIFNAEFEFFQDLKAILYRREISPQRLARLLGQAPEAARFFWDMFPRRRLYVHRNEWYLQLDLENYAGSGEASVSSQRDAFGQSGVDVSLSVGERTDRLFASARSILRDYLKEVGADFVELEPRTDAAKYEDTYHPYGMFASDSSSADAYFDGFPNMLVVNTGVLPRAGGINCTAAVFPLIEEYVATRL